MHFFSWLKQKRRNYIHSHPLPKYLRIYKFLSSKGDVLDAGCGKNAELSKYLLSKSPSLKIQGVDLEDSCNFTHPNFSYKKMNLNEKLPKNKRFDTIIFADVLEHLEHPEKLLKNLSENTSEFIISIPNLDFFAYKIHPKLENPPKGESQHISHWKLKEFLKLIPRDFKVKKIKYCSDFPEFRWSNFFFPNTSFFNQTVIIKTEKIKK